MLLSQRVKQWALAFDWVLFLIVALIGFIGYLNLRSASGVLPEPLHNTQLAWLALGAMAAATIAAFDYRLYERWSYVFYGVGSILLFLVLVIGAEFNGSRRWLDIGPVHIQPSEPMKLATILIIARYFSSRDFKPDGYSLLGLAAPFALLSIPMLLILKEPDLGTTILLFLIAFAIVFYEGIKASSLILMVLTTIAVTPLAWLGMEDYQRGRIKTFLQIEEDAQGRDWQVNQSVIAVGAGGLTGKGFAQGTQIQKGFVPEPENDFALANWAEEQGFIGSSFLLFLYASLVFWGLRIARTARDRFGMLVAVGVSAMIFWQTIINFGMVLRVMPVVGITLPLVSYGGSSVMTILMGIGLLMNISIRRHVYKT
jgi:rod shape determining protein RodA